MGGQLTLKRLVLMAVSIIAFGIAAASAEAAITVTRAELNNGQLRVEGSGATPNAQVVVNPGSVAGTSDGTGAFKIESSPYSSSTCKVTVSDSVSSATATLSGCTPSQPASAPAVTLSPTSLTFGPQDIGTRSAPQFVTVGNTGTASLFINSAAVPNTLDFTVVGDGCSGLTLAVGTSCTMSIAFNPQNVGTRAASFVLTDNASNSPQRAPLTGTGTTAPGTTAPALTIDTQFFSCASGVCDVGAGSNV